MLSEHQKTVSNWIIKTELKDSKQHITITAADLESIRLKPYEYFVLEINDFKISKEATIANNIEIKYPNAIIDGSNTAFKNKFSQTTSLDVISHAGKQLPLHVALIPNQKLINDESENTIKINLTNTGLDPMVIPLSGLSIFMDLKQESGHFPTAFIEKDRIKNVIVQAKNFPSKSLGSTDVNAKNATVVWEEQENISLQPNDQFTIELSKIQTKLPEGTAPFTIRLKNIAGFRDKDFGLVVKRELFKLPKFKIVIVNFSTNSGNYEYKKSIDIGEYAKYQLISVLADKEVAYLEVKNQELIIKTTRTQDVSVTLTYINKEFY
jgi:hypothetical protein